MSKITSSLCFDFKYLENLFALQEAFQGWPTVQAVSDELKRLVVSKVLPILGKNVQITGWWIITGVNLSISGCTSLVWALGMGPPLTPACTLCCNLCTGRPIIACM